MTEPKEMQMNILAIDPGTTQSAWVVYDGEQVIECGIDDNASVKDRISLFRGDNIAIEMIASYGMPVGKEVFETCLWVGRFIEAAQRPHELVYRLEVKMCLCHSARASDANIRQAIIDRFAPTGGGKLPQVGVKSKPGPLFGVSNDIWAALGVAITFATKKGLVAV